MGTAILAVIVLAIVAVLVLAFRKPDSFSVRRAATIRAPAEKIYPLLEDFRRWPEWSPWEGRDPAMRRDYGAVARGPGATYAWEGNRQVGQGRMEITASQPPRQLDLQLDFLKPFEAHNRTVFRLLPQADGTEVVWEMSGPANFMSRLMQVFMDMDRMVGRDFDAGLAKLKSAAEAG